MAREKRVGYWGINILQREQPLFDKIDTVRRARGMSRKGFIMHGIANMCPELTEEIVSYLISSDSAPRDRVALLKEAEEAEDGD